MRPRMATTWGNELESFGGYTAQGEAAARTHTEKLARLWKQIPFRVMWDEGTEGRFQGIPQIGTQIDQEACSSR